MHRYVIRYRERDSASKLGVAVAGICILVLLSALPLGGGLSADGTSAATFEGPLDGLHFVGSFGPEGEPADLSDAISFADGQFWSKICVPCGFPPGPYWVRIAGDEIHFRGTLESPGRGRFVYEGVVSDGRLTASVNWRRERWYWTIDRNFWFEGTLSETDERLSAAHAASLASSDPKPSADCVPGS